MCIGRYPGIGAMLALLGSLLAAGPASANPTANDALREALEHADKAAVVAALEQGANPNAPYIWGDSPTWFSKLTEWTGARRVLQEKPYTKTALEIADVIHEHGGAVLDEDLYRPIASGNKELIAWALDHGARQSVKFIGYTPTELALAHSSVENYEYLVSRGGPPANGTVQAQIGLTVAAVLGMRDKAVDRIAEGAHVNQPDPAGYTALNSALANIKWQESQPTAMVLWLLKQRADPNMEGYSYGFYSSTPFDAKPVAPYLPPLHCFLLNNAGALDGELGSQSQQSALGVLNALLEAGAKVSGRDAKGQTPLHWAVRISNVSSHPSAGLSVAQALIRAGAKVGSKDNDGRTPLDWAEGGMMINFLKQSGAIE